MTNTAETLLDLNEFREEVNQTMLNREIIEFDINSIDIDNEIMSVNGDILSDNSVKKILGQLRVKNNFLGLAKSMSTTDWNTVKDKLKNANSSRTIYGRKVDKNGSKRIDDIYVAAPKSTGLMEINSIFTDVIDSIVSTGKDISIKSKCFLEDKDEVNITLLEHDSPIDIFGNETDLWKTGKQIVWNGLNFSIAPFYERLICSNGNTAPQYGFKANISNRKFNSEKIRKTLEKEITMESDTMNNKLIESINHLKYHNVSINEFDRYRKFFNPEIHGEILKRWFDEASLNKAYGCIVSEQSNLWKISADSGKNAYDFFNDLTYIASHPSEAVLSDRERIQLQINASNLLFKKELDLEMLAPILKWN